MTWIRRIPSRRLVLAVTALALVVSACSTDGSSPASLAPGETPEAVPTLAQTPIPPPPPTGVPPTPAGVTPVPTETPAPTDVTPAPTETPAPPTSTAPATAAPVPVEARFVTSVLSGSTEVQEVFGGTELVFEVSGFEPLELVSVTFEGPGVFFARPLLLRADSAGRLRWSRGSRGDRPGAWSVNAEGDLGSRRTLRYLLSELDLPLTSVVQGETLFNVYHIPESKLHFDPGVRNATVAMISQFYRDARRMILEDIGFAFEEPIDFFLLPEASSLQREVVAGGASGGSGFEAGVSLLNFARSGVYIDMSIPDLYGYAHIVAHELVHQITGRIEGSRRAPLWFIEGFADYYGHDVGLELVGDQELPWRRLTRAVARRAVEQDRWIDLATVSAYEVWLEETSLDRLERMYAESYVTADYVARTYGEAAIRPLLEALADRPDELDGVFLQLFNVSFSELQAGVREDVLRLDAYELELRAVAEYASAVFDILDGAEELSLQWNLYIVARPSLSVPERIARLQALQNSYRAFDADVAGMTPPDAAAGVHEVFVRLFPAFIEASEAFLELERGGGQDAIDRGNAALDDGNLFLQASRDLLVKLLADSRIAISEVFGG